MVLKMGRGNLPEKITSTQSPNLRQRVHSRSWMIESGVRRWYLSIRTYCSQCGQARNRVWKRHPFPLPKPFGKGLWLTQDCRCVTEALQERRNKLRQATRFKRDDPLPPALRGHCFENFKVGDYNKDAHAYCRKFADNFASVKGGEGLFLYGQSGVGKTHLAAAVVNRLKDSHWAVFVHVPSLLDQLRRQARSIDPLQKSDLLVLDDLGSERSTDWALEQLLVILDGRINHNRSTILTANYDSEQWNKLDRIVGMRLASRIKGQHLPVLIQGPDWRQQKRYQR